jgi:signal transduction histidine kinase
LNFYCSNLCKQLFYESKQNSIVEKTQQLADKIQNLDALTASGIAGCVSAAQETGITELIVTDHSGTVIYAYHADHSVSGQPFHNSQVITALEGFRVFTCSYEDLTVCSIAAIPFSSYGIISGCIYIKEVDAELGQLLHRLQIGIFAATILLELALLAIAIIYTYHFSTRMKKVMACISVLQGGNYDHKLELGGHDELTVLGAEFDHLTDRLQESEAERRRFVSDASHELKTPLASIKLLSDSVLHNDMDMDTVKDFVGDIGNEADRLIRMTGKLLTLSKAESASNSRNTEIIPMVPTMERVAKMISGIATEKNIQVDLHLIQDSYVLMTEDDLYQIAFNLAENGIKYTPSGGKITLSLYRQDVHAMLQVEDTGIGIPQESIEHIFDRFYRVDKARSRQTGGNGLGLSIVKNVIERNNGEISVHSIVGRGTTFTVKLPRFEDNSEER